MSDVIAPCTLEDGSAPGQAFPCLWDALTMGNGHGQSFVLDYAGGPANYIIDGNVTDGFVTTTDPTVALTHTDTPNLWEQAQEATGGHVVALALLVVGAVVVIRWLFKH